MNIFTEIKEGVLISFDALRANKLRAALTTLGIIIGIVTVTLMGTAIEGLNQAFLKSISAIGADVLFVQKHPWFSEEPWWKVRNRRDIMMSEGKALMRQLTLASAVALETYTRKPVRYEGVTAPAVTVVATTEQGAVVGGLNLTSGRFLSEAEVSGARPVCVIGADLADGFFPFETPLGKRVRIENIGYEIVGVLEKRGKFLSGESLDNQIFIPISRFATDFMYRPYVHIKIKVRDMAQMDEAREELRGVMRKVRRIAPGAPDDFAINEQAAFIRMFNRVAGTIASVGLFITGLSLFVGGIGIMNIMFVSVAERTREIGLRKALGAKRRTILIQFLIEAAAICLLGGLMGLGIAWPVSKVMTQFFPTTLSWTIVSIALGVSIVTGIVAGFFPAWRAARMNPVDALRNE
ncbi:MAG: ABC transporter permease [Verrucomicrobiota bacterium]